MSGTLDAWGFIGDTIGIVSFFLSLFSGEQAPTTAAVRVYAALNGNGLSGADGAIDHIVNFDQFQTLIGNGGGTGTVGSGQFKDVTVSQLDNRAPSFSQIFASNDAICTPMISMTFPDGQKFPWTGDHGWYCGLDWYWGNVPVSGGLNPPRCTWIDGDNSDDIKATNIIIGWTSFADNSPNPPNCGYPAFRAYNHDAGIITKRADEKPAHNDTRLVISSIGSHNATELCQSGTSRGPDFVSLTDGLHCDMATRQVRPICQNTGSDEAECFAVDGSPHIKRDGRVVKRQYSDILRWDLSA